MPTSTRHLDLRLALRAWIDLIASDTILEGHLVVTRKGVRIRLGHPEIQVLHDLDALFQEPNKDARATLQDALGEAGEPFRETIPAQWIQSQTQNSPEAIARAMLDAASTWTEGRTPSQPRGGPA